MAERRHPEGPNTKWVKSGFPVFQPDGHGHDWAGAEEDTFGGGLA